MKNYILLATLCFTFLAHSFGHKHFVLISAPGSGKGTFSQYMVKKYGYEQICPGDIFRNEIALGTELGKQIQPIVDSGEYVHEDIVCQLVEQYISNALQQNKLFILDGFPRSTFSFNFLCSLLKKYNIKDNVCFLQFIASDTTCIDRIVNRLVCTHCFTVYSETFKEINTSHSCKNCKSNLSRRKADTKSIAESQLKYFHTHIEPLMILAEQNYLIEKIKSEHSVELVEKKYEQLLFQ